jgi:hypothetical protein
VYIVVFDTYSRQQVGLTLDTLRAAQATHAMGCSDSVWATALAIAALKRFYASRADEWVLIGNKVRCACVAVQHCSHSHMVQSSQKAEIWIAVEVPDVGVRAAIEAAASVQLMDALSSTA